MPTKPFDGSRSSHEPRISKLNPGSEVPFLKIACGCSAAIARSGPQPLLLQALVEAGDVIAVTVEQQRRFMLAGADHFLGCLAPARMRHGRIDIGPKAVFGRLQRLPHALRPFVGEGKTHDRLIDLKPYFHGTASRSGAPCCLAIGWP